MADGVTLSAGSADGAKMLTDDTGAPGHAQVVKLAISTDGSGTLIPADGTDGLQTKSKIWDGTDTALVTAAGELSVNVGNTVTVASHAVTNAGTFATQVDGAALTALQLLDDAVFAEDVAAQAADKGLAVLAVRRDADTSLVGTDNDYANLQVNANGALKVEIFDGGDSHTVDGTVTANLAAGTNNIGDVDIVTVPAPLSTTGGGTEAAALRVTLASDSTGLVSVDDNGGSLTVDGTVTANLAAGTNNIGDVDVLSVVPGTGATALGKAVDDVAGATDTGVAVLAVRDDSLAALTPADGDYVPLRVNSTGALHVTGGGGGTEYTVNAAAPADPTGATFVMERDDQLAALTEIEGDWTQPRATSKGALWVAIPDTNGDPITSFGGGTQYTEGDTDATITGTAMLMEGAANALVVAQGTAADGLLVNLGANNDVTVTGTVAVTQSGTWDEVGINDSGNSITVDNGGTFAVQVDGSALTALQLIDDPVMTLGTTTYSEATTKGMLAGAIRRDADTSAVNTDNEAAPLLVNAIGALKVEIFDGGDSHTVDGTVTANLAAGTNNIGDVDVLTIAAGSNLVGDVGIQGRTTGGLSFHKSIDLDESEEEVKASAGTIYSILAFNLTTGVLFLKLYNATAASVSVGTTVPDITIPIPANADSDGAGFVHNCPQGYAFGTAISAACTTGIADNDSGAPAANACAVLIGFK